MIDRLLDVLEGLSTSATPEEICDAIWLAPYLPPGQLAGCTSPADSLDTADSALPQGSSEIERLEPETKKASRRHLVTDNDQEELDGPTALAYHPSAMGRNIAHDTRMPTVSALPGIHEINRALRPLRRRYKSSVSSAVDEVMTATSIADSGLWYPTLLPSLQRWLSLTLIVDDSESMVVWQQTCNELRLLLERLGAFSDLRTWRFDGDISDGRFPRLCGEVGQEVRHRQLFRSSDRQLVLVVSDCVRGRMDFWISGPSTRGPQRSLPGGGFATASAVVVGSVRPTVHFCCIPGR